MLTALELHGFKSFADKTRFVFPDGITVVVGPNGSGKSNIVDAMKWVLGEQSAKSLRGKDMQDVIFKGSGGKAGARKPSNAAEATIVFDNSSGLLAVEESEVNVTRRVYRSGESEYLLNGTPCRLRDIKDLFRGTGVGTDAYSLIEQGKVDTLLQASTRERRAIFEEAAGISRFKAKKVETQRRLDRVEQNLTRLSDIVEEVETRLRTIKNQASKARRYKEYTERLKQLRTQVGLSDWRRFTARLAELEGDFSSLLDACSHAENDLNQAESRLNSFDDNSQTLVDQLRSAETEISQIRQQIAVNQSTMQSQRKRLAEHEHEIGRYRRQLVSMTGRAGDLGAQLEQVREDLSDAETEHVDVLKNVETQHQELQQIAERFQALRQLQEEKRTELSEQVQAVGQLQNLIGQLGASLATAQESIERCETELSGLESGLKTANSNVESLTTKNRELNQQKSAAEEEFEATREDSKRLAAAVSEHQRKLVELQKNLAVSAERADVLEALEKRNEGLSDGVRELLDEAQNAPVGPLTEVMGMVADVIRVDVKMAAQIDAVLGDTAQFIVTSGTKLRDAIVSGEYQPNGRIGVVSLEDSSDDEDDLPNLEFEPGVYGRGDQFVDIDQQSGPLARFLFRTTWCVEGLQDALRLWQKFPGQLRFVTKNEDVVEFDGSIRSGPRQAGGGIVSRRSELRALHISLLDLEAEVAQTEEKLDQLTQESQASDQKLDELSERTNRLQRDYSESELLLNSATERRETIAERKAVIDAELSESKAKKEADQKTHAESETQLQIAKEAVVQLESELGSHSDELKTIESTQETKNAKVTASKVELAKSEQRVDDLKAQLVRFEEDQREKKRAVDEVRRQLNDTKQQQTEVEREILRSTSAVSFAYLQVDAASKRTEVLAERNQGVKQERAALNRKVKDCRKQLNSSEKARHEAELELSQLKLELDTLVQRVQDDYEIDLAQAAAEQEAQEKARQAAEQLQPAEADRSDSDESNSEDPTTDDVIESASDNDSTEGSDSPEDAETKRETAESEAAAETDQAADEDLEESTEPVVDERRREEIDAEISDLRRKINNIGAVNMAALEEIDQLQERHDSLAGQYDDLVNAKDALIRIINRINADSRRLFTETLEAIRTNFQRMFRRVFGGGSADIILEEGMDILEAGIDIVATPPGKQSLNMSLLSGGERALTAVTLLLAIFEYRPSPFCVLDEVDGPLDEANIGRFTDVLREFLKWTKFVVVTHSKKTMTAATTLYGVTMQESGISKRVSVQFDDVTDDGHIRKEAVNRDSDERGVA